MYAKNNTVPRLSLPINEYNVYFKKENLYFESAFRDWMKTEWVTDRLAESAVSERLSESAVSEWLNLPGLNLRWMTDWLSKSVVSDLGWMSDRIEIVGYYPM